jgi:hypothetical protein
MIRIRQLLVQGHDTGEHLQMGTNDVVVVNGVSFTRAQLVAMGDFSEEYDHVCRGVGCSESKLGRT